MDDVNTEAHLLAFLKTLREKGQTHIAMGSLISLCDKSTIAPFLLALSLMTLIPLIATPAGLLSALLYWQMLTGKSISSSSWLGKRAVSLTVVAGAIDRFNRLEKFWGPYIPTIWPQLCVNPAIVKLHCIYGLACSLGVVIPIPGINYLFGPSLLLLSLALVHINGFLALLTYCLPLALIFAASKIIALMG